MAECKYCIDGICVNADSPNKGGTCPLPTFGVEVGDGVCLYEEVQDNG